MEVKNNIRLEKKGRNESRISEQRRNDCQKDKKIKQ